MDSSDRRAGGFISGGMSFDGVGAASADWKPAEAVAQSAFGCGLARGGDVRGADAWAGDFDCDADGGHIDVEGMETADAFPRYFHLDDESAIERQAVGRASTY